MDGVAILVDGRVAYVNPTVLRLLGARGPEEVVGRLPADFLPPGAQEAARARLERRVSAGEPSRPDEHRILRVDGTSVDVEVVATPFEDDGIQALHVLVRDVSRRKRDEAVLQRTQELLEARVQERTARVQASERVLSEILETALDGFVMVDASGRVTAWNARATAILGWTAREALGRSAFDLAVPPHVRVWAEEILAGMLEGAPEAARSRRIELPLRRKDGAEIPAELSLVVVESPQGRAVSAFIRDLTEARKAEALIRDGERRLRQIIDLVPQFIFAKDLEGRFVIVNEAVAKAYGTTVERLLGRRDADFAASEEEVRRFRRDDLAVIESGRPMLVREETLTDADGRVRILETTKIPFTVSGTHLPAVLGVSTDITDRKRIEADLVQAQKMEGIGRLAGGIAHDFNNLLTAILGYAQMLETRGSGDLAIRKDASGIREAAERAASLTRQLLTFARRERGDPRAVDLSELTLNLDRLLRRVLGADIELVTLPGADLGPVEVDPGRLEQVLVNLVVNARDAMPGGGRLLIETRAVGLEEAPVEARGHVGPGPWVEIRVADSGEGMPPDTLSRVFEPFFTTKGVGKGTGLGLAICYGIVKQYGGHIWAESTVGKGTTFHVLLPRSDGVASPLATPETASVPTGTETILVVDDESSVREVTVRCLRAAGYEVLHAPTATGALAITESHPSRIDLLVTDIVMPGMGGPELAAKVIAARPGLRVLFISGYHDVELGPNPDGGAPWPLLSKPFTLTALAQRVRRVLDEGSPRIRG